LMKLLVIFQIVTAVISAAELKEKIIPRALFTNKAGPNAERVAEQLLTLLTETIGAFEEDLTAPSRLHNLQESEHSTKGIFSTTYLSFGHLIQDRDDHQCDTVLSVRALLGNDQFLFTVTVKQLFVEDWQLNIRYFKTESIVIKADPYVVPPNLVRDNAGEIPEKALIFGFRGLSEPIRSAILDTFSKQGVFTCHDGPTILNSMSNKTHQIDNHSSLTLHHVEKTSTRDGHRTYFTSTTVDVAFFHEMHHFQLDITFQHQEDPKEKSCIPKKLCYQAILIALKRLDEQ